MSAATTREPARAAPSAARIGGLAVAALRLELATWPKPGLVSLVDSGSHPDMDAATLRASAEALRPFFAALAAAGSADARLDELRAIGRAAERAMLAATGGVNTHRGAIFGLGLLCAAAGWQGHVGRSAESLGAIVRRRWGSAILGGPVPVQSHGAAAWRRYQAGGARAEAAAGFPGVYGIGLPALRLGLRLADGEENAARVQACFALIAALEDTNLLHRGGSAGLAFARRAARNFLARGGVGQSDWQARAVRVHREFVRRRLSPGGSADLLAATLLASAWEAPREPLGITPPHDLTYGQNGPSLCQPSS